jgi:hypothetical protein
MNNKTIIIGWVGLLLLVSACEKEGFSDSGNQVPITFSMSNAGYSADEEVRSAGSVEPETVTAPLGDDLYLSATLEVDPADPTLRAQVGLKPNQRVQIAAFKGTVQQGLTITYVYSGSTFTPYNGATPLMVEGDGSTYTFVAYSYYGDPETTPGESGIHPSKDLVWGSATQAVSGAATVNLNMVHKFSQVRVTINASTDANNMSLDGVQVLGGKTANLTPRTGDVAATSTNAPVDVNFPSSTAATQTSGYAAYYKDVTGVKIGSITMATKTNGSKSFTNESFSFSKALTVGWSYTLTVRIERKPYFGPLNLYMDKATSRMGMPGYRAETQGLFFKWGSLIGISPIGGETSGTVGSVVLWIPNGTNNSWTEKTISASGWTYATIPTTGTYGGDICEYLTGKTGMYEGSWRLPTLADFTKVSWISSGDLEAVYQANKYGGGYAYPFYYGSGFDPLLPASGYRDASGVLTGGGFAARYWTNVSNTYRAFPSGSGTSAGYAYPVRCVRAD